MARKLKAPAGVKITASGQAPETAVAANPTGGNVSAETIKDFTLRCKAKLMEFEKAREEVKKAQAEASKAQGSYRAELKAAGAAGVDSDAIIWYLRTSKRDIEDVDRETRARNKIAEIMGLPIGSQLGLFPDGESVATKVDNAKQAAVANGESDNPEEMGYRAAKGGKTLGVNPFNGGSEDFELFERGWGRGVAENVTGTPNGVVQAVAH